MELLDKNLIFCWKLYFQVKYYNYCDINFFLATHPHFLLLLLYFVLLIICLVTFLDSVFPECEASEFPDSFILTLIFYF